jgi:hypothetical protein
MESWLLLARRFPIKRRGPTDVGEAITKREAKRQPMMDGDWYSREIEGPAD